MRRPKDPRINASSISPKSYLFTFLFCNGLCAALVEIYTLLHASMSAFGQEETMAEAMAIALGIGGYVLFASTLLSMVILFWRRFVMLRKVEILNEAARKVSAGDYTVRIPPQRKDGKKDEFEVLYDDFNSMTERLGKKTVLREDFLSNISHEFKTPLSVINNYVTILQSGMLSEQESQEYMEKIRLASVQLSNLVGNILQISRLENWKVVVRRTSFDLSDLMARIILGFDQAMTEKKLHLETDLEEGLLLYSDEGLLGIVFSNLLSNAVKFTPGDGTIWISAAADGTSIRVSVRDSGCGISAEEKDRIFEKFYQADHSHSTKGNGLGLAMVKNILELLECGIDVQSEPGNGAEFILKIPAFREAENGTSES